jgi:hypothetical protein
MGLRRAFFVLAASAAIAVSGGAVSGCAGSASDGGSPGNGVPSVQLSFIPPSAGGSETLTGTVAEGVEPGCLVLTGPDGHHVLVFDDPAVRSRVTVGVPVTVSGQAMTGQATTCMQGVPFLVTAVRAN